MQVYVDYDLKRQPSLALQREVQARTEQLLREAGIKVLNESDWSRLPDGARLRLDIIVTCARDPGSCGYGVHLMLDQHVQLISGQHTPVEATTWQNSYTGSVSKGDLPTLAGSWLYVDAGTLVRDFIDNYREANSR